MSNLSRDGLRSRGTEHGEQANRTIEEMASDCLAAIRGAAVRAVPAGRLVLIDSRIPWLDGPDRTAQPDEILMVQRFARDLGLAVDRLPRSH